MSNKRKPDGTAKVSSSENPGIVPPEPKRDRVPYRVNSKTIIMVKRGLSEEEIQAKLEKYKDCGSVLNW